MKKDKTMGYKTKQQVINGRYLDLANHLDNLNGDQLFQAGLLMGCINKCNDLGLCWNDNEDEYNELINDIDELLEIQA